MKNGIFAFAAMVLLLAGMASAGLSVDSYTVTPSSVSPGGQGTVQIVLRNVPTSTSTANNTLDNILVYLATTPGIQYRVNSPVAVGSLSANSYTTISVPFLVLPDAKGGALSTQISIYYQENPTATSGNRLVLATITVSNPAILSLSSDHQTVLSTDTINLTITNNGGAATRANLKIADGSNFSFIGKTSVFLGDINDTLTVPVQLDSRKVSEGLTSVPFVISYIDEGGSSVTDTKYLTVAVKKEKADVSFTQLEPIVTNKDNVLRMSVKNKGRALSDFRVLLTDENVQSKDNSQITLGNLATGAEKSFEIPVFVNEQPGIKSATFDVKWVEDDVEKEEVFSIPLAISSDAEVGIYLDAKPTPIAVGGDYTLSATVSNLGSYKIANVVVSLADNSAFDILNIQQEQYIGNLDNDAFSTVQYKIRVLANVTPGQYPLVFKVRYKDQSGIWIDKNVSTVVSIRPLGDGQAKGDGGLGYILAIVVIAGAAYWYFRMRKPKAIAK
ncbi:Uncharacterised protein [uncultured archaeon]|nr:Uncharacterised protein [uncultured archaeon]